MKLNRFSSRHQASDFTPDRDWRFLFGGFLILTVGTLAASVYLYRAINSLEVVSQARMAATTPLRLDQANLDKVMTALKEKESRFNTLQTTPPPIVDPSR